MRTQCQQRLKLLYHHGYVTRDERPTRTPSSSSRSSTFWTSRGPALLAAQAGIAVTDLDWRARDNTAGGPLLHRTPVGHQRGARRTHAGQPGSGGAAGLLAGRPDAAPGRDERVGGHSRGERAGDDCAGRLLPADARGATTGRTLWRPTGARWWACRASPGGATGAHKVRAYIAFQESGSYQHMPDEELFVWQAVALTQSLAEILSKPGCRAVCLLAAARKSSTRGRGGGGRRNPLPLLRRGPPLARA